MKSKILDLIDFNKVDTLLEGFNKTTGFVTAILDLEGNVLSKSGWRQICTEFHRVHPETLKNCTISDTVLSGKIEQGEKYHFYQCLNGLIDVAVPIVIKGEHVANLFSGQFFFEQPDGIFFKKQAEKYGFKEDLYLKALRNVPVVSKEKVLEAMNFLLDMTQLISEMTFQKLEESELITAIRESENFSRMLFEQSSIGLALASFDGKLVDVNTTFSNIIGRTIEEAKALSNWDITPDKYLDQDHQQLDSLAKTGRYGPYEKEYIHKDGHLVPVRLQGLIIERHNEKFIWSSVEDITEKKIAEAKGREKDLQFRKLSANVPDLIFQFTRKPDGTYYVPVASEGIRNIFGCSPEDVVDDFTPIANVLYPDDVERVIADIEYSAEHLSYFTCEFRVQIPGRPVQWIFSRSSPEKLPDGSVTWYGFNADITQRKEFEDALRESEGKFRKIYEEGPFGMSLVNSDFKFIMVNRKFCDITGYTESELKELTFRDISFPDDKDVGIENIKKLIRGEISVFKSEKRYVKKDGQIIWGAITVAANFNKNGTFLYNLAILEDVTEQKRITSELIEAKEHAEESDRLKTAFLANMSHEIRTPLNGILGFTELLVDPEFDQEQKNEMAKIILDNGELLLSIINDVLDVSKIEAGQVVLNYSFFEVPKLITEVKKSFDLKAEKKGLELKVSTPNISLEIQIYSDLTRTRQILNNLISNAIKYTENGYVEIGFNEKETELIFYVKDTGIGISLDSRERIFGRFNRNDAFTKKVGGTGLGLSIAKSFVELLGGKIWVDSEINKGSIFFFSLPIR